MNTIEQLKEEAINSTAVNHVFLKKFSENDFENMDHVVSVFAYNYYEYSKSFQRYLCSLISKIENSNHRKQLLENLFEEAGNLHDEDIELLKAINIQPEWVEGIEHPTLFRNFLQKVEPFSEVQNGKDWAHSFLSEMQKSTELEALGMLSIGTESIVKDIYKNLLEGLRKTARFSEQDLVFFSLHSEIDDEHGEIMISILNELIEQNPDKIDEINTGIQKALQLRVNFWDNLYDSANLVANSQTVSEMRS